MVSDRSKRENTAQTVKSYKCRKDARTKTHKANAIRKTPQGKNVTITELSRSNNYKPTKNGKEKCCKY